MAINVVPASVRVTASITASDGQQAAAIEQALGAQTPATLSAMLGVTVISAQPTTATASLQSAPLADLQGTASSALSVETGNTTSVVGRISGASPAAVSIVTTAGVVFVLIMICIFVAGCYYMKILPGRLSLRPVAGPGKRDRGIAQEVYDDTDVLVRTPSRIKANQAP